MQTIHLVFKTHLDVGFTDHAEKVRRQYHERFIPQAIETAEHYWRENADAPAFIWTTGAWLIWDHLETQDRAAAARLEQAIERGLIRWHALPFTTHSELMSPALFRAGLSISAELDRRFSVSTIAAKMTDVPGHTRGIVPMLTEAGVRFLHLGVNTAAPVPDVPDIFRWRAPGGEEIVVMVQASYGTTHLPAGFDDGLSFAHTNDNMGPQSIPQVADAYRELGARHPDARVKAATLEDYGTLLWTRREQFPVVDLEIGDSWIYGSASDPTKTQRFLALQRLYDAFTAEALTPARLSFGRGLAMVAEHTCGVDIKSYLRDETAWDRPAFEALRSSDYRFAYTEASWAEQRAYLDVAVAGLEGSDRERAEVTIAELSPPPRLQATIPAMNHMEIDGWRVVADATTGDLVDIVSPDGARVSGRDGSLVGYRYESYDARDIDAWLQSYLQNREPWAILDHGKPGLDKARTARSLAWSPQLVGSGDGVLLLEMPQISHEQLGAPRQIELALRPIDDTSIEIGLTLRGKPANRMPEASFVTFTPEGDGSWEFLKMGLWQPAERLARRGGGQLQAARAVRCEGIEVALLDTPLVAPVTGHFMHFNSEPPDFGAGLRFNLHNNKWGTNFPMWWEGDFHARFVLKLG